MELQDTQSMIWIICAAVSESSHVAVAYTVPADPGMSSPWKVCFFFFLNIDSYILDLNSK